MLSIPLHDDEVLASYLSRLSYAHGIYRMRTFCRDIGLDTSRLKIGDTTEVRKLAKLTDVPLQQLLASAVTSARNKPVQLKGHVFNPATLKREYLRFCPHCLADDLAAPSPFPGSQTYYRAIWFFPQVTACIAHERAIVEIERPGTIETQSHDFCALIGNLPDGIAPLTALSHKRKPTDFEKYVAARLEGRRSRHLLLDGLSLEAAINMCERFGVATTHGRKATSRKLTGEQLALARNAGFQQLKKGEHGILAVFDKLAASTETAAFSPHGCYGELYMSLHKAFKAPEYEIFRDLLKKHALTQNILAGTDLFGSPVEGGLVRVRDVAAELGIAPTLARATLKRRGRGRELASGLGIVKGDAKRDIEKHLETVWSWAEAREHLGCDLTTQRKLYEAGILTSDPEYTQGTCDKREVLSLERRLREVGMAQPDDRQVSLWEAVRPAESNIAEIIQIVLSGKLDTVSIVPGMPILKGLRVMVDEIKASYFPAGAITMSEAAELLCLSASGISTLLTYGGLKAEKLAFPREKWWAVDRLDAERFHRDYITLFECREISKRTQNWLSSNAKRQGIQPAFPTSIVVQAIFERRFADAIMTDSRR